MDQGLNNEEKWKGFFNAKLQPRLDILMKKPKHCMPAQTVDHTGGPMLFIFIAKLWLELSLAI